ncbi:MAG: hypothetical protein M4579_000390 [Chaenotheca gracillima]|nr:MAG: hypothetical protein M4579_000390 [Chaenotheca gracillima]
MGPLKRVAELPGPTRRIYHPIDRREDGPILLYFPRGPLFEDGYPEESVIGSLAAVMPSTTIVRVNYRFGENHKFPLALHDSVAAFDWVVENLVRPRMIPTSASPASSSILDNDFVSSRAPPKRRMLGVCGELVGGSLASALALTECRLGRSRITAAAVNNPLVDWTFGIVPATSVGPEASPITESQDKDQPSENHVAEPTKRRNKIRMPAIASSWTQYQNEHPSLSGSRLNALRSSGFPNTDSYLDPFASPLFFFRTPDLELHVPLTSEDIPLDSSLDPPFVARRRSPRRYPPTGFGLSLPNMRVTVGTTNLLEYQGIELAALMKRSMVMSARRAKEEEEGRSFLVSELDDGFSEQDQVFVNEARAQADRKVVIATSPGVGLWSSSGEPRTARDDLCDVGRWFHGVWGISS